MQVAAAAASSSYPLLTQPDDDEYPSDHAADPCFGSDFGGLVRTRPAFVFHPKSPSDVSDALKFASLRSLPIAPRGNGHSVHGQAQAPSGLVLNMRSLSRPLDLVREGSFSFADVAGGTLWSELLTWSVEGYGLAPASWTDYLDLTVGGTLSNGGISGQAFLHGPQVSNVTELVVVTPDGERHVCSRDSGSDLFFAVLGGLGQFGVITRARIPLLPAPDMVKWIRVVYVRFSDYKQDAEFLVTRPESFNYVEGFVFVNSDDPVNGYGSVPLSPGSELDPARIPPGSGPVLYCLEVALHYQQGDNVDKRVAEMLRPLRYVRGLEFSAEVSYVDFLTRVKRAEEEARANGSWNAPHPWLNLLVSSSDIVDFDRNVFQSILKEGIGGPMLVYPLVRSKWDPRTSVALPDSEIFYLVALLRVSPFRIVIMPRRSSGRSAARVPPQRAPARNPPAPVHQAPPPAPVQSGGGSILGGIGSTIAQGMAFGTGSAVAHRAVDAVMGPRTIQHETVASQAPEAAAAAPMGNTTSGADSCNIHSKSFQDCINNFGSDISKCQFYLDMLNECRRGSAVL